MKFDFYVENKRDLIEAVRTFGFVPLFKNSIKGFSVEEHVAESAWFDGDNEGVWEWKGPVIRECGCAYGKFFDNKAVFADKSVFADLANYRRNGYDFDARYDDGLAPYRDKTLYDLIEKNGPVLSKELKNAGGYGKEGRKGFDTIINRLQAQCYVVISDFVYETGRNGKKYGWGTAQYSTPEWVFGADYFKNAYRRDPEESRSIVFDRLVSMLPQADEKAICKIIKRKD